MSSKWLLTVALSPNRSRISMKRPDRMRVATLAGIGRVDIDRLTSPPDGMPLLVGKMVVGGNTPDRLTGGVGRVGEGVSGLPDRGTDDSSENGGSDPKGAPACD